MPTMYVSFVFDFFQPSPQSSLIVDEITRDGYLPLIELFNSGPNAKFTVSLPNSLARLLSDFGKDTHVLKGLREAMDSGRIELVHTGAYHPIFPLLPEHEVRRQIELDIDFKQDQFGLTTRSGILAPELCYVDRLISLYRELGFRWTLIDDRLMLANGIKIGEEEIWQVDNVAVLMRSSLWSDRLTPQAERPPPTGRDFVAQLSEEIVRRNHDAYKIIALPGEAFGHHIKYYQETFLREMLFALEDCPVVRLARVSDLLAIPSIPQIAKPAEAGRGFTYFPPGSCATNIGGSIYPHWKAERNPIHQRQWELTDLILAACADIDFRSDANVRLRTLLDRAFYSTQYFWASFWYWSGDHVHEIQEGIDLQMRALYQCARLRNDATLLEHGQKIYVQLMWEIHEECRRHEPARKGG